MFYNNKIIVILLHLPASTLSYHQLLPPRLSIGWRVIKDKDAGWPVYLFYAVAYTGVAGERKGGTHDKRGSHPYARLGCTASAKVGRGKKVLAEWFSTIFTLLRQEFDSPTLYI